MLTVTLLGFENEQVRSWTIPDEQYPLVLQVPMERTIMERIKRDVDPTIPYLEVMEFEHTGPLPGTYRRVK